MVHFRALNGARFLLGIIIQYNEFYYMLFSTLDAGTIVPSFFGTNLLKQGKTDREIEGIGVIME